MPTVFLVQHVHVISDGDDEEEDVKLIGVYSTEAQAHAAIGRLSTRAGFRDHLAGFEVSELTLDKDHWTEGFITWREAMET